MFATFKLHPNDANSLIKKESSKGFDRSRPKGKKKYKIPFVVNISVAAVKLDLPPGSVPNHAAVQREINSRKGYSPPVALKVDSQNSCVLKAATWVTTGDKSCRVRIAADLVNSSKIPNTADFIPYIQWPPMVLKTEKTRVQLMLEEEEWTGNNQPMQVAINLRLSFSQCIEITVELRSTEILLQLKEF